MNEVGKMIVNAIDSMQGPKYCEETPSVLDSEVINAARSKINPYNSMNRLMDESTADGVAALVDIYTSHPGNVVRSGGVIDIDSSSVGAAIIPGVAVMKMKDDLVRVQPTALTLTSNGGFQHVGLWENSINTVSPLVTPVVVGGNCGPSALLVPIDSGSEPIDCAIEFLAAMSDEYYAKEASIESPSCKRMEPDGVIVRYF